MCQPCQEERKRNYQSAFEIGKRPELEQLRKDQQRPVPKIKRIADDANVDGRAIGQHDYNGTMDTTFTAVYEEVAEAEGGGYVAYAEELPGAISEGA